MLGIHFEYEKYPGATVVALNARLEDFQGQPTTYDGQPMVTYKERTVKDCRNIDGCIYMHLGRVEDSVLVSLIEKFLNAKEDKKIWKPIGFPSKGIKADI